MLHYKKELSLLIAAFSKLLGRGTWHNMPAISHLCLSCEWSH